MTARQHSAGPGEAQHFGVSSRGIVRITDSTHAGSGQDRYSVIIQLASSKECSATEGTARVDLARDPIRYATRSASDWMLFLRWTQTTVPCIFLCLRKRAFTRPEEARIYTAAAITGT